MHIPIVMCRRDGAWNEILKRDYRKIAALFLPVSAETENSENVNK